MQIDPGNEQLLQQHLACAAAEMPLHLQLDREFFGHRLPEIASFLQSVGEGLVTSQILIHLSGRTTQSCLLSGPVNVA